jgi:hypothetical protein
MYQIKKENVMQVIMEKVSFKSLIESKQPVSEEMILTWLSSSSDIEFEVDCDFSVEASPTYSKTIEDCPLVRIFTIFNLDPVSAGVLVAGLSVILNWVSTERRHRETLAVAPPGNGGNININKPDICKKIDADLLCKLPLTSTMQVKGEKFLILFRACTKTPEPHTTVEYYEL